MAVKAAGKRNRLTKIKMPKTTCTEEKAFIPSRAPFLAYRASEVVPPVGFASSSDSCNAAPQATVSKKERRESDRAIPLVPHNKLFQGFLESKEIVNSVHAEDLQRDDAALAASA